jgi:hypothetical protein
MPLQITRQAPAAKKEILDYIIKIVSVKTRKYPKPEPYQFNWESYEAVFCSRL